MALIEIDQLQKNYTISSGKVQEVLKGVNLSLDKGELVAVVGESGSGKSTLLNVIGGLDSDYEGSVQISGRNIKDLKGKELDEYRKMNIGFVFQSFNLIPGYTVIENVLVPTDMTTMSKKEKRGKALNLLSMLGLAGFENKMPHSLSGGERQRVAIARALMNDPDIILADEPTGALDKDNADRIIELVKSIARQGKLVLVVTHSEKVAAKCDRIIRLEYGIVSEDGGKASERHFDNRTRHFSSKGYGVLHSLSAAYKNIRKNKLRNILVSLGTGIGIFSVVILLFLSRGIGNYVSSQMYSQANPLMIEVVKQGKDGSAGRRFASFANLEPFTEEEVEDILDISGIESVEKGSIITGSTILKVDGRNESIAVMSTLHKGSSFDLKKGRMPRSGEILVSESVADVLNKDYDYLIGKEVGLIMDDDEQRTFVISGIIENDGSPASRIKTVYANYEDVECSVNILYVTAGSNNYVKHIKLAVKKLGFDINSRDSALNRVMSFIKTVTIGLTGVAAVSLVVSGIMIMVVLFISVVERTKEIGILRAIGAREADIRRIFLSEGTLLGLSSGIIGVMIAVVTGGFANIVLYRITGTKLVAINLPHVILGILISVGISMMASFIPAARASSLDPVKSLRHE